MVVGAGPCRAAIAAPAARGGQLADLAVVVGAELEQVAAVWPAAAAARRVVPVHRHGAVLEQAAVAFA
jgi:hypothetical protein